MAKHDWFEREADESALPPERRILIAAVDCVAESGLEAVTVRSIAARAGLNPASINYYYRSKERLMDEALRMAWGNARDDMARIADELASPAEALPAMTAYLVEGAWRNPRVLRAILAETSGLRLEVVGYLKAALSRAAGDGAQERGLELAATLILSLSVFSSFAPDAVSLASGLDLNEPSARSELASRLAGLLFDTRPGP